MTNLRPSRLLIVDDNEMNRDMLARRLLRKGYIVAMAENARNLHERVKQDSIDLVLLDIEMPEISGLDALQKLREQYSAALLPVIMVTAKSQSDDIVKALDLGANDYLTKPIDFPVAVARIGTQLSHKHAQEALKESEERYALAARGSNDGLWDWNLSAGLVHFSSRWKAMLGYHDDEIGDKPEEWLDRIHDADRERVKEEIAAHQKGQTPHFESEHRVLHKDGGFRWMLSRGVAVYDSSGNALRMAGSQTDITEGKVSDPLTGLPNRLLFIDRVAPGGNLHGCAPGRRRVHRPARRYQRSKRRQARSGPHDEVSRSAVHFGRQRGVHVRQHRNCFEHPTLRTT